MLAEMRALRQSIIIVESSVTSDKIRARIQSASWYLQAQTTLLDTALKEYSRLAREYLKSFENIRKSFDRVNLECDDLQRSLEQLGGEIFYSLAGELSFKLDPFPEILEIDKRIKSDSPNNIKHLYPNDRLSLRDLLELRAELITKLNLFDLNYQRTIDLDNNIPRSRYTQQWQQLGRQMQTIDRQVSNLCQLLDRTESKNLVKQRSDITYEQKQIGDREEVKIRDKLKQLQGDRQRWQEKMMTVLDRAIEQA
jgi:hypothetical protein